MSDDYLSRNLLLYPKLRHLLNPEVVGTSKFLGSMAETVQRGPITYKQVLKTCEVINERLSRSSLGASDKDIAA
jgi:hypothetical protein